jgi:hypothetical protein
MRVVELSDHPAQLLQDIYQRRQTVTEQAAEQLQSQYEEALAQHRERVRNLCHQRDLARAQRQWWTWLLRALSVWSQQGREPRPPIPPRPAGPTHREGILKAGVTGEQVVMTELGRFLDDDWTLLRGYRNRHGEIDHLLLGPRGLFAIEVKHRNATVHVHGDTWHFDKYDRYGNLVEQGLITDRRGRSPSVQLNESASELEQFLRSRGQPVRAERIVVLTHPRSQLGTTENLTVTVATSTDYILSCLTDSPAAFHAQQLTQLEQLIVRDHRHHEARRQAR